MGTSLFSCTTNTNKTKKIDSIEVIDSTTQKTVSQDTLTNILGRIPKSECSKNDPPQKNDSTQTKAIDPHIIIGEVIPPRVVTTGVIRVDKSGSDTSPAKVDDIDVIDLEEDSEEIIMGYMFVDKMPGFKDSPKGLLEKERKDYFSKKISDLLKTTSTLMFYQKLKVFKRYMLSLQLIKKDQ